METLFTPCLSAPHKNQFIKSHHLDKEHWVQGAVLFRPPLFERKRD